MPSLTTFLSLILLIFFNTIDFVSSVGKKVFEILIGIAEQYGFMYFSTTVMIKHKIFNSIGR